MSLRRSMFWLWLLVLTVGSVLPARAHPANEANIYHGLYIKVQPGRLTVEHATIVGGLLAQIVWPQWDTDGDQFLSPTEQARAAEEISKHLSVTVDGRPAPLKLTSQVFASHQEFFTSTAPAALLRFTTSLPTVPASGVTVSIRDETWPSFRGIFPDPQISSEGLSAGSPSVKEDGRSVGLVVRPAGAASSSEDAPSNAPARSGTILPGLSLSNGPLTVPGSTTSSSSTAGRGNSPGAAANAPLRDLDLRKAPIFPDRGKVLWAQPKEPHSETAGLKGLLGKRISLGLILLGLGAALLAGMAHALTPGHGKAMVGAYLVGSRGTVGDAILLGVVVTITHTLGVYLLGFLCLWLTTRIQADVVGNWLGVISGVLVLGMGFWLFQRGLLAYHGLRELPGHSHGPGGHTHGHSHVHEHRHSHQHEHSHEHGHTHTHAHTGGGAASGDAERRPPSDSPLEEYRGEPISAHRRQTKWDLIGLGIAGGMVPCFDALAILIAAVNLGNIAFGLALIAAFSLGLALVLVLIGILMVKAKDLMSRFSEESKWVKVMPAVSGAALFILGTWLTIESLVHAGVVKFG